MSRDFEQEALDMSLKLLDLQGDTDRGACLMLHAIGAYSATAIHRLAINNTVDYTQADLLTELVKSIDNHLSFLNGMTDE